MSKFIILAWALIWSAQSHAIQVSEIDWLMGKWGVSNPQPFDDGHTYTAQLEIKKVSPEEAGGKLAIYNELGQITAFQQFKIANSRDGKLTFALDYAGAVNVPGWWDGPIGPTGISPIRLRNIPTGGSDTLTCNQVTHDFSTGDVQRNQVSFLTVRDTQMPTMYPRELIFNVTPVQAEIPTPYLMLTLRWNELDSKQYNIYEFMKPEQN